MQINLRRYPQQLKIDSHKTYSNPNHPSPTSTCDKCASDNIMHAPDTASSRILTLVRACFEWGCEVASAKWMEREGSSPLWALACFPRACEKRRTVRRRPGPSQPFLLMACELFVYKPRKCSDGGASWEEGGACEGARPASQMDGGDRAVHLHTVLKVRQQLPFSSLCNRKGVKGVMFAIKYVVVHVYMHDT